LTALIIQHQDSAPPGYVEDWLALRGIAPELWRIDCDAVDRDPGAFELVVSLGAAASAYDESIAWVRAERRWLERAARKEVPIVGICFGGQLLARALGGSATRSPEPEIGWSEVETRDPGLVPKGTWLQWHFDTFTPPPGARLVAENRSAPQAYLSGHSLGLQFHPEVTPAIVAGWVDESPDELEQVSVVGAELIAETERCAAQARAGALELFDAFLARVSGSRTR
jgi:GMP synthase-like glutamine amidotransferase